MNQFNFEYSEEDFATFDHTLGYVEEEGEGLLEENKMEEQDREELKEDSDFHLPLDVELSNEELEEINIKYMADKHVPPGTRRTSVYTVKSNQLFLTYPQCPIPKQHALAMLMHRFAKRGADVLEYIVAHEKHKNGDDHLHVYLKLANSSVKDYKFEVHFPTFADLLWKNTWYHGNYQGCRSTKNVQKYCTKAEDYISNFDVGAKIQSAVSHKKYIAQEMLVKPLAELIKEHPELLWDYARLKHNLELYYADKINQTPDIPQFIPNNWGCIMQYNPNVKRRHYWIYSNEPNRGKTTFAKKLSDDFGAKIVTFQRGFFDVSKYVKIIIYDEYSYAKFPVTDLNSMCDGTFDYPYFKQGNIRLLEKNPLIIIIGNKSIEQVYPNAHNYVKVRFIEVCIDNPLLPVFV